MTVAVSWFRNGHEHRNYWLRFGLMRLHRAGAIIYRERPLTDCVSAGFDPAMVRHEHRHTSLIAIEASKSKVRCIVDSEDSFFCMAGILSHADRYFCAGYNDAFFREKAFEPPYAWLKPAEVVRYAARASEIVSSQGAFFDRVRPFVPIGPDTARKSPVGRLNQRLRNLEHKLATRRSSDEPWRHAWQDFEVRYAQLLALRGLPAEQDIVLHDTLWGWPRHRVALHRQLADLDRQGYRIHSRLNWAEPSEWDGSSAKPLDPTDFPMLTGKIDNYEAMLAGSRLAVFATGFHWGWRNIMTLALMLGLPVLVDRLFLQPWFDLDQFDIMQNDAENWSGLKAALDSMDAPACKRIAERNQSAFDNLLTPEKVAEYFIGAALA